MGFLSLPHLLHIALLRENAEIVTTASHNNNNNVSSAMNSPRLPKNADAKTQITPHLNPRSKIFELSNICDMAKV